MAYAPTTHPDDLARMRGPNSTPADAPRPLTSAVSWGAIVAGAAAAASLSLILLILGVGLGLSSVSPWARDGVSAATFGISTIVWLTVTQLLASSMGGYLAGRLRSKWTDAHRDEVYFRDTAHGFLSWAVASLATAALLTSVIGSIVSGGVQAGASVVGGVAGATSTAVGSAALGATGSSDGSGPMAYLVESLFRPDSAAAATEERVSSRDVAEVSRIFTRVSLNGPLAADDLRYVGQLVAQRSGLSQADAEKRVAEVYAKAQANLRAAEVAARDTADTARKASAYSAIWLFVSLLLGAFVASLAATWGGRRRDA